MFYVKETYVGRGKEGREGVTQTTMTSTLTKTNFKVINCSDDGKTKTRIEDLPTVSKERVVQGKGHYTLSEMSTKKGVSQDKEPSSLVPRLYVKV